MMEDRSVRVETAWLRRNIGFFGVLAVRMKGKQQQRLVT